MSEESKLLEKVRGLYAKAAASEFPAEADAFRAKADELRIKWAIEEEALLLSNPNVRSGKPILKEFDFEDLGRYQWYLVDLFKACANFNDVKVGQAYLTKTECVGYPTDIALLDILFTNLVVHMANTVDPKPDPTASEAENIYNLKMAGYKWNVVHNILYPDVPWERRHGVRYTSVMRKHCEKYDLPRNTIGGAGGLRNYRDQFVQSYVWRIKARLAAAKNQHVQSVGNALVLSNRAERLNEEFWNQFPDLRPHDEDCDCETCHWKNCRNRETCQRRMCKASRQPVKRGRQQVSVRYHAAADAHGKASGNMADIGQQRVQSRKDQLN